MEWKVTKGKGSGKGVWDWTPGEVEAGGMEAVLRCPVGWSGDHRVVCPSPPPLLVVRYQDGGLTECSWKERN